MLDVTSATLRADSDASGEVLDDGFNHVLPDSPCLRHNVLFQFSDRSRLRGVHFVLEVTPEEEIWGS